MRVLITHETLRVRVYEIEHDSDLENASNWIRQAGATSMTVLGSDFEGSESALFAVEVPVEKVDAFRKIWKETSFMWAQR